MLRIRSLRSFAAAGATLPALALLLTNAAMPARADDQSVDPDVARVSVLAGSVDVKRGDSGDTVAAAINAPISTGDYITTDDASHAELEFDYGTALRVAPDTQLRFTQLQPNNHELQLAAGTVELRLFRGTSAHPQIQTPQVTVRPDQNGSYLVNVDDNGNTEVTVRAGRADVLTNDSTQSIVPGTTLAITGDADSPQFQSVDVVSYGDFDAWNVQRDRFFASATENYRYTDAGMVGAEDLGSYGRWVDDAQYGEVWVPAVAADWAPYHNGRWVWEPYYGWTWVDAEPWGWAPFHYGNWFYAAGSGWAWYPGAYAPAQPYYYRPALVAFFNFGGAGFGGFGGGGPGVGFGNVGWVPIAPNEPFHPWWHGYGGPNVVNTTVVNNTYINNTTNITTIYRNASAPGGAVGVTNGHFANGNFRGVVAVSPAQLRAAQPIRSVVPVVPTQRNLAFGGHVVAQPIASSTRFTAFRSQPRTIAPSFAQAQTSVKEAAVRTYPEQADAISHYRPAPEREATPAEQNMRPERTFGTPANATAPRDNVNEREVAPQYAHPANDDRVSPSSQAAPNAVRTPSSQPPAYARPITKPPAETSTEPKAPASSPYDRFNRVAPGTQTAPRSHATSRPKRRRVTPVRPPEQNGSQP